MTAMAAASFADLIAILGPCDHSFRGVYVSFAQYEAAVELHRRVRLRLYALDCGYRLVRNACKELAQHRRRLLATCRETPLVHGTRPLYGTEFFQSSLGTWCYYQSQWDWLQTPTSMQDMSNHFNALEAYVNTERFRGQAPGLRQRGFTGHKPVFRRDYIEYHRVSRMCELYSRVLRTPDSVFMTDVSEFVTWLMRPVPRFS
jgi:hypothetical protein